MTRRNDERPPTPRRILSRARKTLSTQPKAKRPKGITGYQGRRRR